jgi:hypothetical protein
LLSWSSPPMEHSGRLVIDLLTWQQCLEIVAFSRKTGEFASEGLTGPAGSLAAV